MKNRVIKCALLFVLVSTFLVYFSQGSVHAASQQTSLKAVALNDRCYNNNGGTKNGIALCNGDDPVSSGCNADAKTLNSSDIQGWGPYPYTVGHLEIRYSPHCKTNWGRLTSYIGAQELDISIGYGDCENQQQASNSAAVFGYSQAWGDMIFAPTAVAYVFGTIASQHFPGCTAI